MRGSQLSAELSVTYEIFCIRPSSVSVAAAGHASCSALARTIDGEPNANLPYSCKITLRNFSTLEAVLLFWITGDTSMNYCDLASNERLKAALRIVLVAIALSASTAMLSPNTAHAQIVSASARYDRGVLVVRGTTAKPRQFVRLNRFRIKLSNRVGQFAFHQTRVPQTCSVQLRSAGRELSVPIRNCPLRYG